MQCGGLPFATSNPISYYNVDLMKRKPASKPTLSPRAGIRFQRIRSASRRWATAMRACSSAGPVTTGCSRASLRLWRPHAERGRDRRRLQRRGRSGGAEALRPHGQGRPDGEPDRSLGNRDAGPAGLRRRKAWPDVPPHSTGSLDLELGRQQLPAPDFSDARHRPGEGSFAHRWRRRDDHHEGSAQAGSGLEVREVRDLGRRHDA